METIHSTIYQNLRLLTSIFPCSDLESKLEKGMFKRPNAKGMQSLLYFLLSILCPKYCHENVPWPVSFTSDNYKFRQAIIYFIETECTDFKPPTLLPSLLNKADGEKYVKFIFSFVTYATKRILEKNYKTKTINKIQAPVDCCEFLNLLNNLISNTYHKSADLKERHDQLMKSTFKLKELSVRDLQENLNLCRLKKEELHEEIKDALSYTNITEKNMVSTVLTDQEDELRELQRDYYIMRDDVSRLLKKNEDLTHLIRLKYVTQSELINPESLSLILSENFAETINVPVEVIKSSLFHTSGDESKINLETFLQLGLLLVKLRMKRFLKPEMTEKHMSICQTANDIFANTVKRFDDLTMLDANLDKLIGDCSKNIPNLSTQYSQTIGDDNDLLKIMCLMKSLEGFCPRPFVPFVEKSLLPEIPFQTDFCEDPVTRMKRMKSIIGKSK